MDYEIAIPSYKRTEGLIARTLATLARMRAPLDRVTVFTADPQEDYWYREALAVTFPQVRVAVSAPGMWDSRNYYCGRHYEPGTRILSIDDDIDYVSVCTKEGKLIEYPGELDAIVKMGFGTCERVKAKLWGISAVHNAFYMSRTTTVGLRFLCGYFFGCYSGDPTIWNEDRENLTSCEDYETTLLSYVANKGVVRLDGFACKTAFHAEGGVIAHLGGKEKRRQAQEEQVLGIAARFPTLAVPRRKADGFLNLRLKPVTVGKIQWT